MNKQQDFSKCKVGDKLWSIQLGDCEVVEVTFNKIAVDTYNWYEEYDLCGFISMGEQQHHQSLFFSNPNIVAPEHPSLRR